MKSNYIEDEMKEEIKKRTKKMALEVVKLVEFLPNKAVGWTFSNQIIRSATSVAANYRAVCRARSDKEFIAKMGVVIEEADETLFWLEMIEESEVLTDDFDLKNLKNECNELISIFVSSVKTVKQRLNHSR